MQKNKLPQKKKVRNKCKTINHLRQHHRRPAVARGHRGREAGARDHREGRAMSQKIHSPETYCICLTRSK